MSEVLSSEDHARLSQAISEAEAKTSGEIYVVVAEAADEFHLVPLVWGTLFALLLPSVLYLATTLSITRILACQAIGFIVVTSLLSLPGLRYRIIPSSLAEDAAHRAALAQFMAHGVHLTEARTGVLVYVSMLPRRVEVVADSGIHAKVGEKEWQEVVAAIVREARAGRLADGLLAAIGKVGTLLARHFPASQTNPNELANRVGEI